MVPSPDCSYSFLLCVIILSSSSRVRFVGHPVDMRSYNLVLHMLWYLHLIAVTNSLFPIQVCNYTVDPPQSRSCVLSLFICFLEDPRDLCG